MVGRNAAPWAMAAVGLALISGICRCLAEQECRPDMHNPLEQLSVPNTKLQLVEGVTMWLNATVLERSGTWIEVGWAGLPNPRLDDLLALYPADADPRVSAPIKFKWAFHSPTHRRIGAGSLSFRLVNMRHDLKFLLLRNGLQFPVVAAQSEAIRNVNPNEPTQGHLTLTGKPRQMAVQWATRDAGSPLVRWGTEPGRYTHSAPGDSITYSRQDMCGPPANDAGWMDPGMLHMAVMDGLEPGRTYYYQFGDEEFGWSEEASFRGPPTAGRDATVRLLAVADLGQAEMDGSNEVSEMLASLNTTRRMAADVASGSYDMLVHNGDISYARGYVSIWDAYWDQLAPVVRSVPYMTTIGNHERDWPGSGDRFPRQYDSGGECGIAYYRRTRMPTPSEDQPWYSFDLGPIHFLQYSTEHEFEPGSPQHAFIQQDLQSVNRSATPWVIVGGHRPMYIDSTFSYPPDGDGYVARQLRESLEDLFHRWGVDATWHGHHHTYQRTCPTLRSACLGSSSGSTGGEAAAAAIHLVIGHAGAGVTPNIYFKRPEIFKVVELDHGYMRVEANATHLVHQVVRSSTGELMDEFMLTKPLDWMFTPRDIEVARPALSLASDAGLTRPEADVAAS